MGVLSHGIYLFVAYWISSIVEWFYHQYLMHASDPNKIPNKTVREVCKRHIVHHSLTNDDMTLMTHKNEEKYDKMIDEMYRDLSQYQGIFFLWRATMYSYVPFIIVCL